jgi:hypothetical protein
MQSKLGDVLKRAISAYKPLPPDPRAVHWRCVGVVNPCARAAASKAQSLRYRNRIQHPLLQIRMFVPDLRIIFSGLD